MLKERFLYLLSTSILFPDYYFPTSLSPPHPPSPSPDFFLSSQKPATFSLRRHLSSTSNADCRWCVQPGGSRSRSFFTEKEHPKLCAYVDRMAAMEGAKRAVQKIVEVEGGFEDL